MGRLSLLPKCRNLSGGQRASARRSAERDGQKRPTSHSSAAELAKLREEFEGKLAEERTAREAAEARAQASARAESKLP